MARKVSVRIAAAAALMTVPALGCRLDASPQEGSRIGRADEQQNPCKPGGPTMTDENGSGFKFDEAVTYKGRTITLRATRDRSKRVAKAAAPDVREQIVVEIDERTFVAEVEDGAYSSILMPYRSYESPVDLAKDVIDYVPAFKR